MGTRDGVEECGRFCIMRKKMTPRSQAMVDVSGLRDSATDPVSGYYDSDGENQAGPLKSNIVKLSCKLSACGNMYTLLSRNAQYMDLSWYFLKCKY